MGLREEAGRLLKRDKKGRCASLVEILRILLAGVCGSGLAEVLDVSAERLARNEGLRCNGAGRPWGVGIRERGVFDGDELVFEVLNVVLRRRNVSEVNLDTVCENEACFFNPLSFELFT